MEMTNEMAKQVLTSLQANVRSTEEERNVYKHAINLLYNKAIELEKKDNDEISKEENN